KFGALARPAFSALAGAAAQTAADAARLGELGTPAVEVCGNLKFDVTPRPDLLELGRSWRQSLGKRRIWLAASTREGEEALVLAAHARLPGDVLLILVPRHPQRFDEVTRLAAEATGREPIRRSSGFPAPESRIWIGDSMGELAAYYAAADLAFVGGSLLPLGGQNLIEAAACGCPVVIGPHTFNFAQATADAVAAGAARQLDAAEELGAAVAELLDDPAALATMATAASSFAATHRGATQRTLALIERWRDREGRWPEPDRLPPGRPPRP
ncbi:MAG TPA: glycosyltransferase N-terminal domain-containing protein, partial [Rhodocyclaceae bacterium]|nr:glycosyltransferase N-terminal domain-containing protein [Rhodocyclaceae bacterium]